MFESLSGSDVSTVIMSVFILLQIVVRLTPTKKDDEIVGTIGKLINLIFNKTNVKGSLEDSIKIKILNDTMEQLSSNDKNKVVDTYNKIATNIINTVFKDGRINTRNLKINNTAAHHISVDKKITKKKNRLL